MTTWDLIIALFYHVDEPLHDLPKHPEAHLWPSEVVTPGSAPCPQRRGQPRVPSLGDARLSALVSPPPRAHPALPPLQDASGLDAGLRGRSDRARGARHLWERDHPPHPGGAEPPADRSQRPLQSSLDC